MNTKRFLQRYFILLFLVFVALFLAGCIEQRPVHAFTMEDNGDTDTVGMNDIVTISLASNPTTGYEWTVKTTGNLVITDQEFISDNVPGMVGEGGFQKWTLSATAPGTYEFDGIYQRPWEETGEDETYHLTLIFS